MDLKSGHRRMFVLLNVTRGKNVILERSVGNGVHVMHVKVTSMRLFVYCGKLVNNQVFNKWLCGNWMKQWQGCVKRIINKKSNYTWSPRGNFLWFLSIFSLLPSLPIPKIFGFGVLFSYSPLICVIFTVESKHCNQKWSVIINSW